CHRWSEAGIPASATRGEHPTHICSAPAGAEETSYVEQCEIRRTQITSAPAGAVRVCSPSPTGYACRSTGCASPAATTPRPVRGEDARIVHAGSEVLRRPGSFARVAQLIRVFGVPQTPACRQTLLLLQRLQLKLRIQLQLKILEPHFRRPAGVDLQAEDAFL